MPQPAQSVKNWHASVGIVSTLVCPHSGQVIAELRTTSGIGVSQVKQHDTDPQADNNRIPCEWLAADATGPCDLLLAPQERGAAEEADSSSGK